jgi:hypothetical protein
MRRFGGIAAAAMALALVLAACQPVTPTSTTTVTFQVTVKAKTSAHPYFNQGAPNGFVIDGVEGKELTLKRGTTYSFVINTPGHPFYLTTSPAGGMGASGEVTAGVTGSRSSTGTLTFTPDASHPALLYYQCAVHSPMGWKINITD